MTLCEIQHHPQLALRSLGLRAFVLVCLALFAPRAFGQAPQIHTGEVVPRDVREIYEKGLNFLATTQAEDGSWQGGESGAGVTGMALMVLLASGEDPNFGLYSNHVRKAVRDIIRKQDATTGFYGNSMYHHGFAMLAMAEAYGTVDDRLLWSGNEKARSIGQSLELAVRCAVTSQKKNPQSAWRYSPDASDSDTSVSGAVLMGLLAARNAGIEVSDESINKAIDYFTKMTSDSGQVAYAGGIGGFDESLARISIATLVYSIARRKDLPQFKSTVGYLTQQLESNNAGHYQEYTRYYQAQALFQGNVEAWDKWNKLLVRQLKTSQLSDGSVKGPWGPAVGTSLSMLALAVNYRFLPIYER